MTGKHVVVTGAGTGIGRAIALRLAREGASLSSWRGTRRTSERRPLASKARRTWRRATSASAVAWLMSSDARGVIGAAIDHNGGGWTG